jgi:NAD(P)-dependent dehydrogenase (short-subunit alcohol dehydrogenase family)
LSNQHAVLITGCSSGIGYDAALELHKRGYVVIASARQDKDVERLRTQGLFAVQLDLACSESIQRALAQTLAHTHGKLYGLFNNGAYGQAGAVEDLSRDVIRKQFETNVFGWMELTNTVIPVMRSQGYGRIIQNSSVLGLIALKFRGAYNASKYAIEGFSDTLRLELEGSNIYISSIEPGPIESNFRSNSYQAFKEHIDSDNSVFKAAYAQAEKRLTKKGAAVPFTLPASAVTRKVIHALESKRPKPHYYVTFPTYLFGTLKRILSARMLDRILLKVSSN